MDFFAFLSIVFIEYVGVGPLKVLPLPISALLFFYVLAKYNVGEFLQARQTKLILVFSLLTVLAIAHGFIQSRALEPAAQQVGYFILMFIAYHLLENKKRIDTFIIFMVSIFTFLSIYNFNKFMGIREGFFAAGYFLGDGNDFAWGLNYTLPLAIYLFLRFRGNIFMRAVVSGSIGIIIYGIIGTQSRGASLAMACSFLYLWLFTNKKKGRGLLVIMFLVGGIIVIAPQAYFERMETVKDYKEDSSATARLKAWGTAIRMGLDHPLLGVGAGSFNSAYGRIYRKPDDPVRWISTHSVYFKVLGEYGFPGLVIWVWLLWTNFITNLRVKRLIEANQDKTEIPVFLPDMLNMSLVGFSAAAMFLSGVSYPHIFLLTALILAVQHIARRQIEEARGKADTTVDETFAVPWGAHIPRGQHYPRNG